MLSEDSAKSVEKAKLDPQNSVKYQVVSVCNVDDIVRLYEGAGWWNGTEQERLTIPKMIAGSCVFMIAMMDDEVVGMGRAISDGASDAYIQDVTVLPHLRGLGIGGELIRELVAELRQRGIPWIGLVTEPGRTAFYSRLGFHVMHGSESMRFPTPEEPMTPTEMLQ